MKEKYYVRPAFAAKVMELLVIPYSKYYKRNYGTSGPIDYNSLVVAFKNDLFMSGLYYTADSILIDPSKTKLYTRIYDLMRIMYSAENLEAAELTEVVNIADFENIVINTLSKIYRAKLDDTNIYVYGIERKSKISKYDIKYRDIGVTLDEDGEYRFQEINIPAYKFVVNSHVDIDKLRNFAKKKYGIDYFISDMDDRIMANKVVVNYFANGWQDIGLYNARTQRSL